MSNGILETRNPCFNVLVLWRPALQGVAQAITNYLRTHHDHKFEVSCFTCYQESNGVLDTSQLDIEIYYDCVSRKLRPLNPPALAVLPRDTLGQSCRSGWVWFLALHKTDFDVIVMLAYS